MTKPNTIEDDKELVVYKGYSLRLFPTKEQEKELLWFCEGAKRVWNWAVSINKNAFKYKMDYFDYSKLSSMITTLKAIKPEDVRNYQRFCWLNTIPRRVIEKTLKDVNFAFQMKFKKISGWPKFKPKNCNRSKISFGLTNVAAYQSDIGLFHIVKIKGKIKFKGIHNNLIGMDLINPRIHFIQRGNKQKWLITYCLKHKIAHKPVLRKHSIGIDLNVKNLAVTSSGKQVRVYKNINKTKRVKRLEVGLKNLHRKLSRRKKGSKNWEKARKQLNGKYYKLACIREDYIQKVTTKIVKFKPKCIVLETLDIKKLLRTRPKSLAKNIMDQKLFRFRTCILYKGTCLGIEITLANRFFPSSKKCSRCGNKKRYLSIKTRTYVCDKCGLVIDRDLNAAKNLEKLSS